MSMTLCGFTETLAAAKVNEKMDAITDEHIKTESEAIVIPELNRLLGIYAIGLHMLNPQLASPSLRRTALYDISPCEPAATPSFPPDLISNLDNSLELEEDEYLSAYSSNSDGVATPQQSMLVLLGDGNVNPISGKVYTIRATTAGTIVAYTWAALSVTLTQTLPVGDYKLVGVRCESALGIAFRMVFIGGLWRPGTICVADSQAKDVAYSRNGAMGVWGEFAHNRSPSIELFSSSTAGATVLYLDLMKV